MIKIKELPVLEIPAKQLRSKVIADYMMKAGIKRAVCFSCGNASRELRLAGVDTIDVSPTGGLIANKWWTPAEIKNVFKDEFDATSGHLPLHLMMEIAAEFKRYIKKLPCPAYAVPTGSGETIICLQIAFPKVEFTAVYNMGAATAFEDEAPLNTFVKNFFNIVGV